MGKKRISYKDWTFIGKYNYAAKWCRPFCTYTLTIKDSQTFEREQRVNLLAYIVMFIPLHILQAFVLMWDGGLKEFEVFKRKLGKDVLSKGSTAYDKARDIFFSE